MILLRSADELRECRKSSEAVREWAVAFQPGAFRDDRRSHECPDSRAADALLMLLNELSRCKLNSSR